jgi:phosphatidylinositol-3-phosphatase
VLGLARRDRWRPGKRPEARLLAVVVVVVGIAWAVIVARRGEPTTPLAAAAASWQRPCGQMRRPPARWSHVVWIWFENQDYAHAVSGTAIRHLASRCGVATRYYALTHPSLPNYVAAVSGATHGITKDCACTLRVPSLMQQAASWRLYAEAMPHPCDTSDAEPYQAHHNVATHFPTINCQANDVSLTQLGPDLAQDRLPRFSLILPDACHSMHYTKRASVCHQPLGRSHQIAAGNLWLKSVVRQLVTSRAYRSGTTAIFITWDEGYPVSRTGENCLATLSPDCHTAAVVVAPSVAPHTIARTPFSHYSLLRTTEQLLGLTPYLGSATTASSMGAAFHL